MVCPTPLEEANFVENPAPGALYTDTCPRHTTGKCEKCDNDKKCTEEEEAWDDIRKISETDEKSKDGREPAEDEKENKESRKAIDAEEEKKDSREPAWTEDGHGNCRKCRGIEKTCEKVKVFEIALVQAKLTYNKYGWHDPEGRFFVLKEELERWAVWNLISVWWRKKRSE